MADHYPHQSPLGGFLVTWWPCGTVGHCFRQAIRQGPDEGWKVIEGCSSQGSFVRNSLLKVYPPTNIGWKNEPWMMNEHAFYVVCSLWSCVFFGNPAYFQPGFLTTLVSDKNIPCFVISPHSYAGRPLEHASTKTSQVFFFFCQLGELDSYDFCLELMLHPWSFT